jgi:segregation and condensation protein A
MQEELPLAMVDGQPFKDVPSDLYIPPDALEIILESFEGPLDLLLYLIRRQNMDVLSIDVSAVTEQYMEYIRIMEDMRFELAAEYLVMASMLAEVKSRSLLPKRQTEEMDEEDPRAELIRRLQEYERFKAAAEQLDLIPRADRDTPPVIADLPQRESTRPPAPVSLADLLDALQAVLKRSELFEHHHIEREKLSTRERMSQILDILTVADYCRFESLFRPDEGRLGVVVTFLALLELVKESLVDLVQTECFGAIHVKARSQEEACN